MSVLKKSPQIIGRKSYIDFPLQGITGVPAKIDTGADSSAIWASDIEESDGKLTFKLFDITSPFYTGKQIETKKYKLISVKNSFGIAEFRYKVTLSTVIETKKVNVRFTLADRSNSSQPVLIGRRTLKGKFLVDVTIDPDTNKERRILFVSAKESQNIKTLVETVQAQMTDTVIERATYDDMTFSIQKGVPTITIESLDRDLDEYDIIHFKTSVQRDITAAFARYATTRGVRVLDPIIASFPTTSKLYEYIIIADHDVSVPDTMFVTPARLVTSYDEYVAKLGLPFVLKGIHSSRGEINDVVRTEKDFNRISKKALKESQYLVGQRFVPNNGDYRVLTMGKQIRLVIHRERIDKKTHLNNTSTGATARLADINELPSEVQIQCIEMAALMGRDIAGIDIVQDSETEQWHCFEVNDGPQIATGAFKEEKQRVLAEYLERELEK